MSRYNSLLIINPISGTLSKEDLPDLARKLLRHHGFSLEVVNTTGPGDATRLASMAIRKGYHSVLVAGGDGTVNEVASALRNSRVILGIIPCGSGNGLARHCNISLNFVEALELITKRHIISADCGLVNGIPFFCTFGLGFDATVSESFAHEKKRGPLSYVKSVVKEYIKYKPDDYEIIANSTTFHQKAFVIAVCNASQYGNNALIAPQASIKDGQLDITIIHSGSPLTRPMVGVDLFTGNMSKNVLSQTLRVKHAVIHRSPGIAHIDGEPIQMPDEIRIDCLPGCLRIYTAPEKKPFRPFLTPLHYLLKEAHYLRRRLLPFLSK